LKFMYSERITFKNLLVAVTLISLITIRSVTGKTRWSSLHIVPDADLFTSGEFTIGFDGFLAKDTSDKLIFKPTIPIEIGISEWVNLDLAYAGGMTLGIKCRILGETAKAMPSIAVGVHNLFNHSEVSWFSIDSTQAEDMTGEIYLAASKGVDAIKTRFHLGLQTIPASKKDEINPYFAVEKYFGVGLYSSLEFYRRQKEFHLSLFANWRVFKKHLEISFGAVDLRSMFFDEDNKFAVSLAPFDGSRFVKPGIWMGVKFHGSFGLGSNKGFMSVEDRMRVQDETIESLVEEIDSLNTRMKESFTVLEEVRDKMGLVLDSVVNDPARLENIIFDKLIALKSLYQEEPFDPQKVKLLKREIASFREKAIPSLEKLLLDQQNDRYIRMYSAAMLGEIGNTASSDVLLNVLAKTTDPDIKIEILIALGKMKETRAMYLLEQLANSPNDAIAITAQEVLLRLSEETGADITPGLKMRRIRIDEEKVLTVKQKGQKDEGLYTSESVPASVMDTTHVMKKPSDTDELETAFEEEDVQTGQKDTIAVEPDETEEEIEGVQAAELNAASKEESKELKDVRKESVSSKEKVLDKEETVKEDEKESRKQRDRREEKSKKDEREKDKDKRRRRKDKDRDDESKKKDREKGEEEKEREDKNW